MFVEYLGDVVVSTTTAVTAATAPNALHMHMLQLISECAHLHYRHTICAYIYRCVQKVSRESARAKQERRRGSQIEIVNWLCLSRCHYSLLYEYNGNNKWLKTNRTSDVSVHCCLQCCCCCWCRAHTNSFIIKVNNVK